MATGIYNAKKKDRFRSFSAKAYEIKNPKNFFSVSEIFIGPRTKNHIKVELKKRGQLDQAMLFSKKFHLEVFYEDGEVERREMEDVPIFASFFPTCESFSEEDYTVSVKEVFVKKGAQKENMLINSAVIEWEKDRKNHNPAETLTKIQFVIE